MSLYAVHLPNGTSSNTSVNRLLGQFLTGSGVVGSGFAVSAQDTPNMSVKVSGSAANDNLVIRTDSGDVYHLWNTSDINVTITSNSSGVTKTDAIVAYADTALVSTDPDNPGGGQVIAVRRADALTGAPTDDEIDTATGGKPWLKLKEVTVANGALSINSGNLVPGYVVSRACFAADTVPTAAIQDLAVTTGKIANANITSAKLAQSFFKGRYQSDDNNTISNSDQSGLTVQFGWSQSQGGGGATLDIAITFPIFFSSILLVVPGFIGVKSSSAASSITNTIIAGGGQITAQAAAITTTGCSIRLTRDSGTFTNTEYWAVSWIAIGVI